MSVRYDPTDKSLVFEGFENGIADSPFQGIADMRNVNIVSVPGEASVNFSTSSVTSPAVTGTTDTSDAGADTVHFTSVAGLENYSAIKFSATTISGVSTNTVYWLGNKSGGNFQLFSDYGQTSLVNIGSDGTGTFSTYNMSQPKYLATDNQNHYFLVDKLGQVWSNLNLTTTNNYWTFTGNKVPQASNTNGNGLVYYQGSDGTGWLFLFHNSSIDYTKTAAANFGWNYQWNPTAGTLGGYSATPSTLLNTAVGTSYSHEALVGQDNTVYYCDSNFIGSFFEKPTSILNPLDTATYTWAKQALKLPYVERANCLAELGVNLLVGGQRNLIYPWNRVSTSFTYPIFLSESVVSKMVTVNTNTFIFAGNRGRIFITNGSQAQLYKKIPDHISGTVEPYFVWGAATFIKNQLYFSVSATTNAGTALTTGTDAYGGVWAIDLETKGIRLTNQLSYGTYAGYATALIAINPALISPTNPSGGGLYIGWDNGNSGYGLDQTSSSPYTGSQAIIDSDLAPIGTYDRPKNATRAEYRLTKPMVAGESVTLQSRLDFSQNWNTIFTDSTAGHFSSSKEVNFENAQWLQIRAILNSTASSPSYTRLKEFRITGING